MPQKTHTKILATIGPSSASKEQIEKLIDAGCDAFRFNFSHGTHAEHKERFEIVRKLSKEKNRHITLVADMQGPKLRVGPAAVIVRWPETLWSRPWVRTILPSGSKPSI